MIDNNKVKPIHLQLCAYVQQSTTDQVEYNRESTKRQCKLAELSIGLGWSKQ